MYSRKQGVLFLAWQESQEWCVFISDVGTHALDSSLYSVQPNSNNEIIYMLWLYIFTQNIFLAMTDVHLTTPLRNSKQA